MLLANGSPKITDFGIAQLIDRPQNSQDKSKNQGDNTEVIGTPHYMSPEHIKGKGYDSRSDVFSLGIVAYEWLTGKKPFVTKEMKGLLSRILLKREKSLEMLGAGDKNLSKIITKSLAKSPDKRFQSAYDLSDAIELYLNTLELSDNELNSSSLGYDKSKIINKLKDKYIFFADFSTGELSTIFKLSHIKKYITGEYIIREGTVGTKMYVIISGRVSVRHESEGQDIEIQQLDQGSCVGEMALIDKLERSASVVALEPAMAIAINETVLRLSNPKICLKLYKNLASSLSERLRVSDERLKQLMSKQP